MANENSVTIGKVIPTFKGDWNANTSYSALDVVVYKNTTYVAETDILTGTEPKEGTGEWSIMARGAIGPQGPQGERGKQIFKSSSQTYTQNSSGNWWSDLTPSASADNPPKVGDTIITSSGDVFQISTVNVGDGGGGGGTFGVGGVLGNIKGPQGPIGPIGPKGDMDLSQINLGGRNLLVGSKNLDGAGWDSNGGSPILSDFQGLTSIPASGEWSGPKYLNSFLEKQGKITSAKYILSAWVNNTGTSPVTVGFYSSIGATNEEVNPSDYGVATIPENSGWVRIASKPFNYTKTTGLNNTIRFEPMTQVQGGVLKQAGLKLEIGNIATDWTPAPEDTPSKDALSTRTPTFTDFNDVAKNMVKYSGSWVIGTQSIANSPLQNYYTATVTPAFGDGGSGYIELVPFANGSASKYIAVVGSNTLSTWKSFSFDDGVVHKTGTETIADDKTFSGNIRIANLKLGTDTTNVVSATARGQILDGYDLNGYTDSYKYVVNGAKNLINYPSGASNWAALEVENINGNTATQTLKDSNSQVFIRSMGGNPAKWSAWRNVSDPGDPWKVVATAHFESPKIANTSANSIVYYKFGSMVLADFHRENVTFSADIDTSLSNDVTIVVDSGTIPPKDVNEWMAIPIVTNKVGVGVDAQATRTTSIRVRAIDGPLSSGNYVKMGTIMYHTNS